MRVLTVGEQPLSIEDVVSVARGECQSLLYQKRLNGVN